MDNVVLIGGLVVVGDGAHLVAEAEPVFLQILIHVLRDGGTDIFAKEGEGFLPLSGDFIAGAVVAGLLL